MNQSEQVAIIAEVLSENVGFDRQSANPDAAGWRDIVEFLLADDEIRAVLLRKYADRLHEREDVAAASYDADTHADRAFSSRMDSHYFELAKALASQEARKLKQGGA